MIASMRRRALALVLGPLLLAPLAGCGYSLAGRGSALPANIKTIVKVVVAKGRLVSIVVK